MKREVEVALGSSGPKIKLSDDLLTVYYFVEKEIELFAFLQDL